MKLWKRAAFWAFGWTAKVVASLWLSTCRISEFGREIEEKYLTQNPDQLSVQINNVGPREWRGWVTKARVPRTPIARYVRMA